MAKKKISTRLIFPNYGLMWRRDYADSVRGRTTRSGTRGKLRVFLLGINRKKKRKEKWADFREQIGVYALYDKEERIIYAGLAGKGNKNSGNLYDRLNSHFNNDTENRIRYFSWFGLRQVNDSMYPAYLDKEEKKIIHRLEGIFKSEKYTFKKGMLLQHLEALLIQIVEPVINKRGADWRGSERYFQYVPDHAKEPTMSEVLTAIKTLRKEDEIK